MKFLNEDYHYEFKLVSFKFDNEGNENDIKKYCEDVITVTLPLNIKKRYFYYLRNYAIGLFKGKISLRKRNYLDFSFSWKMQKEIDSLISNEKYDLVFVDDFSMVPYVSDKDQIKKVLTEINNTPEIFKKAYEIEDNFFKKIIMFLNYLNAVNYEKTYEKFDLCVTVTERVKKILYTKYHNINCAVVPFGVEVDSRYSGINEDFPNILFLGTMSSIFNEKSALYIYEKIYPLLRKDFSQLKFFIVGKGPSKKILRLGDNKSVIVTGFVKDIKYYISRASVVVLPIHGFGIKTRLLEVMSVGKSVVTNLEAVEGINVSPGKNIIVASSNVEFVEKILILLKNEDLRKEIGINAKKLMEEEYSWRSMAEKLNVECQKIIKK